ncbi:TIR domain-containing protein [Vibrio owensii]|uniref:TIR domain-containing protein n=1 Tax=Vibrio owensii TaxID=696485 RepID=UPI002220E8F0|nr:TIR domain-containing protein [Vibrio owensii]
MSYQNKTYVIFDSDTDIIKYRTMTVWKVSENIDFNFHNAHDLKYIREEFTEDTIKKKLRERLANTKQALVIVGKNTRNLHSFLRWEIEVAISLDIPIIAINLCNSDGSTSKTPSTLIKNAYFVSIPFDIKKIKYALDNFPSDYHKNKSKSPSSRFYDWSKIRI